jgi:hypothetical protein
MSEKESTAASGLVPAAVGAVVNGNLENNSVSLDTLKTINEPNAYKVSVPINEGFESLALHQTLEFDALRKAIKKFAPMFAFGEPTKEMVCLMIKVYHENILRLLSDSKDVPNNQKLAKLNCMLGIFHSEDNVIYVTISESPGVNKEVNSPTDKEYMAKRNMTLNILRSAGIDVRFPERGGETLSTFPEHHPPASTRWRKGTKQADNWETIYNHKKIVDAIDNNVTLKGAMFLDEHYKTDTKHIYDRRIRALEPKEVYWVDSYEYLKRREKKADGHATGPTFRPYKKYSLADDKSSWKAECNNGHICTESKLFGYAAIKGFKAQSFVAYWIGKGLAPENHIIRSYCYRTTQDEKEKAKYLLEGEGSTKSPSEIENEYLAEIIDEGEIKLPALTEQCFKPLNSYLKGADTPLTELARDQSDMFKKKLSSIVQPCAVVCPGCFANMVNYKRGKFSKWDIRDCYAPRVPSARLDEFMGGKRKTKRKGRKAKKQTRKSH